MNEDMTIALIAAGAVATVLSLWGSRRKLPFGRVSLIPWNGIMFAGVLALVVGIAHLAALSRGGPS